MGASSTPNVIPPMTHPLSRAWDQPSTDKILIDDEHAVMDQQTMIQLKQYYPTIPSGVYAGKMWRAQTEHHGDFLMWYSDSDNPDKCCINSRQILLLD